MTDNYYQTKAIVASSNIDLRRKMMHAGNVECTGPPNGKIPKCILKDFINYTGRTDLNHLLNK
jgi:hypothetical protein